MCLINVAAHFQHASRLVFARRWCDVVEANVWKMTVNGERPPHSQALQQIRQRLQPGGVFGIVTDEASRQSERSEGHAAKSYFPRPTPRNRAQPPSIAYARGRRALAPESMSSIRTLRPALRLIAPAVPADTIAPGRRPVDLKPGDSRPSR